MPFLDKTGLAHLWNQIIARLNGKVEREELLLRVPDWADEDEGAILQIVNGTPTWVKIPNAEEASF